MTQMMVMVTHVYAKLWVGSRTDTIEEESICTIQNDRANDTNGKHRVTH